MDSASLTSTRPFEPAPPHLAAARRFASPRWLAAGGVVIVAGAALWPWLICPTTPCTPDGSGAFQAFSVMSGLGVANGTIAALAGLILIALARGAARNGGRLAFRRHALAISAAAAVASAAWIAAHLGPDRTGGGIELGSGPALVIVGSGIAAIAAARIRVAPPTSDQIASTISIAFLCSVALLWGLELTPAWRLGQDPAPTVQALIGVLLAVSVGLWPGRLPTGQIAVAASTLLCVSAAFAAVAAGLVGSTLVFVAALVPVIMLGLGAVLPGRSGPERDLDPDARRRPTDRSRTAVIALSSLVTLGLVGSVGARLVGLVGPIPQLGVPNGMASPEFVDEGLLAVGLTTLGALLAAGLVLRHPKAPPGDHAEDSRRTVAGGDRLVRRA